MAQRVSGWEVKFEHFNLGEVSFQTTIDDPVTFTDCGRFAVFHIAEHHDLTVSVDSLHWYRVKPV